jgi:hypothetical protein
MQNETDDTKSEECDGGNAQPNRFGGLERSIRTSASRDDLPTTCRVRRVSM